MDIGVVNRVIDDKIIWTDDPDDPVLIEVVYKHGKYKKDPRTWYALYNFFGEEEWEYLDASGDITEADILKDPRPIIITLNRNTIEHYINKFEYHPRLGEEERISPPSTLIEMRRGISRQKEGPWLIDYQSDEETESRGTVLRREKRMRLRGPEKYMHSTIGHEGGHIFQEKEDLPKFSEYTEKMVAEEDAWIRSIPGIVSRGDWDEPSRETAIQGIGSYYRSALGNYLRGKYYFNDEECTAPSGVLSGFYGRVSPLSEIVAMDFAQEFIDEVAWFGQSRQNAEERLHEMANKVMENFPDMPMEPEVVYAEDIFKFEGLPIGWTIEKEDLPIRVISRDEMGELHTVEQDYRFTVYDENGRELSGHLDEEKAIDRAKKHFWNVIPWEAPISTEIEEEQEIEFDEED